MADALSRTIFPDEGGEVPSLEEFGMLVEDEKNDPVWIWKDGKGGYEELLKRILQPLKRKKVEILCKECGGPQDWLDKLVENAVELTTKSKIKNESWHECHDGKTKKAGP